QRAAVQQGRHHPVLGRTGWHPQAVELAVHPQRTREFRPGLEVAKTICRGRNAAEEPCPGLFGFSQRRKPPNPPLQRSVGHEVGFETARPPGPRPLNGAFGRMVLAKKGYKEQACALAIHTRGKTAMIIGAHSVIYSTKPDADRAFLRDVLKLTHVDV